MPERVYKEHDCGRRDEVYRLRGVVLGKEAEIRKLKEEYLPKSPPPSSGQFENKRDRFHAHLDNCKQCDKNPYTLCLTGASLLKDAAVASP
jgi:hypothetical protein